MACSAMQCRMHSIWCVECALRVQALQLLAGRELVGALHWRDAHVVVHTGGKDADLLYNCGLGTGAGRRQRNSPISTDCTLSLEEAFFLQYALRCLTVHANAVCLNSSASNAPPDAPHATHKSHDATAARQPTHSSSAAAAAASAVTVRPTGSGHAAGTRGVATTTRGQSDPGTPAAAMLAPTQRSLNRQIIIQPGIHPPELDYTAKSASAAPAVAPRSDLDDTDAATPSRPPSELSSPNNIGLARVNIDASTSVAQLQAEVQPVESPQAQHMHHERADGSGRSLALTEEQLWTACSSLQPCWASDYATYHHFRCKVWLMTVLRQRQRLMYATNVCASTAEHYASNCIVRCKVAMWLQGWLPKPGLQYGGHFVLYAAHPETCHSAIVVRWLPAPAEPTHAGAAASVLGGVAEAAAPVSAAALEAAQSTCLLPCAAGPDLPDTDGQSHLELQRSVQASQSQPQGTPLQSVDLMATLRVVAQVRKRLLLLYLQQPSQLDSPTCIDDFEVRVHTVYSLSKAFWCASCLCIGITAIACNV